MAGIPEDLIVEILLRLPLEALLRFRCVSKRWRNLIDSPNFVKSQLNLPNKPQYVMVLVFTEKLRIFYAELDAICIENPSPNFKELTLPSDEIFSNFSDVVGHCNGLLCCVGTNNRSFLVLNPFTGKHILVEAPEPPPKQQGYSWAAPGFGYDRDSDDYKIVVFEYRKRGSVVWIYSLKSGCWKKVLNFRSIPEHANGVFVNGALHWIGRHCKGHAPDFIFALNLGNLEYSFVPRPSDYSKELFHLEVLDGRLCAIYADYDEDTYDYCYDLWVMKEYGSKESWTRLGTYDGIYEDRDFLFVSYGDSVVLCKFGSLWWKFCCRKALYDVEPLVYEPSLVCARSGMGEDEKDSLVIS